MESLERVREISDKNVLKCLQCGTCSASCPFVGFMDATPRQIMRMLQLGRTEVLESRAIWLCATCMACADRCPRDVGPASILEAMRLITLRKGIDKLELRKVKRAHELPPIALIAASRKFTG